MREIRKLRDVGIVAADQVLEPYSRFLAGGSQMIEDIRAAHAAAPEEPIHHTLALSLVHLTREVEGQVEALRRGEDESSSFSGIVTHLQTRILSPAKDLLQTLEQQREEATDSRDEFFAFDAEPAVEETAPPAEGWLGDLLSTKELERQEAVLTLIGSGLEQFLRELPTRAAAERDLILRALWEKADLLLLEGRGRSRAIFEAAVALATDAEIQKRWHFLFLLFKQAGGRYWDPVLVRHGIAEYAQADQRVFGRSLLLHPWEVFRRLALGLLAPPDFWGLIAHQGVPIKWILELWLHLKPLVDNDYLKIFFVCICDRLKQRGDAARIVEVVAMVKELFKVDCFHEDQYFRMLLQLDREVRAEARRHKLLIDFDSEYVARIREFTSRPSCQDLPIRGWGSVPLPIQRLLARRGKFLQHFACHPVDLIAMECLRHLLRRDDVGEYLKLTAINGRLLAEMAKEERFFKHERNKYLLVANPKTPAWVVAKHIGYLRTDSIRKISHSPDCNLFARDYAKRILAKRDQFRAGPPT